VIFSCSPTLRSLVSRCKYEDVDAWFRRQISFGLGLV
jgi:hypothetical protein